MPKKVTISLRGIVNQINQATGKLSAAKGKAANTKVKQQLVAKIKRLNKIKTLVQENCKGLNIAVPTKPAS